jgi:hypothetical protein
MGGGNIIRKIGGESIKRAKKSIILESTHDNLTLYSAKKVEMVGGQGGVEYLNDYVPPLPLRVVKLDGPFDEKGQKVTVLEKEKWYIYKVVQFNRGAKEYEIKDLKWATKFDNQPLNTSYSNIRGLKEVKFNIDKEFNFTKFVVYAYFEKPIDEVSIEASLMTEEVIIIVGTEQHTSNPSNKMMFLANALLVVQTRKFINHKHLKIIIYRGDHNERKYTETILNTFKKDILKYNSHAEVIIINSTLELINCFNTGNSTGIKNTLVKRKIKEVYAFAHGTIISINNKDYGIISFGMDGPGSNKQYLGIDEFKKISPEVFIPNQTHFYSYACRTGAGTKEKSSDPKKEQSLAQKMADHGKIIVHAFIRRSQYENTWGTKNNRKTYESDHSMGTWKEKISNTIYDWWEDDPPTQNHFEEYMKTETKVEGYLWNSKGSYMLPVAGDSPELFPKTYETFYPKKSK